MYIDELQLRIGKNLSDVLCNIRSPAEPLNLWIDANCINQTDDTEKGAQVQDMANIDKDADQMVRWFGELIREAQKSFQLLHELTISIDVRTLASSSRPIYEIYRTIIIGLHLSNNSITHTRSGFGSYKKFSQRL